MKSLKINMLKDMEICLINLKFDNKILRITLFAIYTYTLKGLKIHGTRILYS